MRGAFTGVGRNRSRPVSAVTGGKNGKVEGGKEKILGKGSPRYGRLHHLALFRAGRPTEREGTYSVRYERRDVIGGSLPNGGGPATFERRI